MLVHYSSVMILAPALVAALLGRWPDAIIVSAQAAASSWHHSTYSPTSLVVDRLALSAIVMRTILLAATTYATMALFVFGFGYMFLMYSYGFYNKCFSFDPRPEVADRYHASIHVVGAAIYASSMLFFLE
jgi:hypothetical protein